MPLLRLDQISLHYGTQSLLDEIDLHIEKGDRLGLLGRNGAGKTTLLKVLAGDLIADTGERRLQPDAKLARLEQTLPQADEMSVYQVIAEGLAETGALLNRYHQLTSDTGEPNLQAIADVQQQIESSYGWAMQQRVETVLSQLQLPADVPMRDLSGGWRRRVALGKALACEPDVLLLDEPTNHLDLPTISWLEEQLLSFPGAIILVTHDRRFLQQVSNCIAELDRGQLTVWRGDYRGFLEHREQQLRAEQTANNLFDKKLAQEEAWIRQGIKARRTRNEGRVRALKALREERSQRRERQAKATFSAADAEKSGKIVAEAIGVSHHYGDRAIIRDFSTIIQRGDRIGIVGSNGAGKTTLLKILLGEIQPERGSVKLGSRLELAYSDQLRDTLEPDKNLIDNICGGQEFIDIDGKRRHALSYLGDFLFSPQRARMP
ncbi:MAG: ATP-binding cassette domain-containing protein, partial [Pseudomonadota bacterium]